MTTSREPLVDSHCHLAWPDFRADVDAVIARMREAGVSDVVTVAIDAATARESRELAERFEELHPTAGIHPNDLPEDFASEFAQIEELLRGGGFVAVGETGLDDYRDAVPPARQREAFARHAALARELDLPLIVHVRDRDGRVSAYDDVERILAATPGVRGVIHCFTGTAEHARRYVGLGFHIGISGIVTYPKGDNVREAVDAVPLERLLVETDAPFLAPVPWRGKRNEPSYVAATARKVAELKGVSEDELRRITTANARALFRLAAR
jgi:TatD DNase family protein